jgi:serine/threonine-protein kinase
MEQKLLGNYRIVKKIGEGGMGAVYLALDVGLERMVAVKIISPELARSSHLMARFRVEAIAQARLNHPNIVTIHSFEQLEDTYYIVMEYMKGKTLKDMIKEKGKLPVEQALRIFFQLLEGIAYAHRKGVLHRDIKPANIFVKPNGTVKIGDFGIAKVSGIDGLTRAGAAVGTPLYSSPEQIRGEKMGTGTDIYSMGVVLYEMLTGVQPFKTGSGSDFEIQEAHLEKIPGKPSVLNPNVTPALDDVVMKGLAKSPAQRFRSAEDLKKAVAGLEIPDLARVKKKTAKKKIAFIEKIKGIKNIKNLGKNMGNIFKVPAGAHTLKDSQKRKLLIILIPLLILLLIIIAFADNTSSKNIKKREPTGYTEDTGKKEKKFLCLSVYPVGSILFKEKEE